MPIVFVVSIMGNHPRLITIVHVHNTCHSVHNQNFIATCKSKLIFVFILHEAGRVLPGNVHGGQDNTIQTA